jgi:diguanylate cyclase (GGDEF)-like protein
LPPNAVLANILAFQSRIARIRSAQGRLPEAGPLFPARPDLHPPTGHLPPTMSSPSSRAGPPRVRSTEHLEILNEIARIATGDLDLGSMLQRVTDAVRSRFGWDYVSCMSVDRAHGVYRCEALSTDLPTEVFVGYTREIGSGVVGEVSLTGRAVVLDDVRDHPAYVETQPGTRSELCVPVLHRGETVAILNLESQHPRAFHGQLPLMETVAEQVAGAIAGARLHEELQERARLLEMVGEVSKAAMDAGELGLLLDRVVEYIEERFPLVLVSILMVDLEEGVFTQFTPETQTVFRTFADQLAGAIHMAAVNQELVETNDRLLEANQLLERLSQLDGLTGIANHRAFDAVLETEWRRAGREHLPLSLLMIDIDCFKDYNDRYGHQGGDDTLRAVAATLQASLGRAADFVARYGGEEFVVLLPGLDAAEAAAFAETLRVAVERLEIAHEGSPCVPVVTISVGVGTAWPAKASAPDHLLEEADRALYAAKRAGRNRVASA